MHVIYLFFSEALERAAYISILFVLFNAWGIFSTPNSINICENSFNTCHLIKGNIQADPDKGIKTPQKSSWLLGNEYSSFFSSPTFDFRQMFEKKYWAHANLTCHSINPKFREIFIKTFTLTWIFLDRDFIHLHNCASVDLIESCEIFCEGLPAFSWL